MSKENKSPFAELLDELDTLQKSFPAEGEEEEQEQGADDGDAKIQAAADGDRDGDGKSDGEEQESGEDDDYDDMAKALGVEPMEIVGDDGKKQKAYDGLQVLKAMSLRMQESESDMAKALGVAVSTMQGMSKRLADQQQLIKSLQEQVAVIGDQGKGRKAMLSVLDKQSGGEQMTKSEGLSGQEIMSKAMTAQKAGGITGVEVARLDSYLGRGMTPPAELLAKIGLAAG